MDRSEVHRRLAWLGSRVVLQIEENIETDVIQSVSDSNMEIEAVILADDPQTVIVTVVTFDQYTDLDGFGFIVARFDQPEELFFDDTGELLCIFLLTESAEEEQTDMYRRWQAWLELPEGNYQLGAAHVDLDHMANNSWPLPMAASYFNPN